MPDDLLKKTIRSIPAPDLVAADSARRRLDRLTKPQGSLGRLEDLAVRLAAAQGRSEPSCESATVYTIAADHGIAEEGVSAYPREVTAQMVLNFLRGGAGINVLARQMGAHLVVADFGVASSLPADPRLFPAKIRPGTGNFRRELAMTRDEALRAVEEGIRLVGPSEVVATGEMGIANTTSASAITAAITGRPPSAVTGRGTGIDPAALENKVRIVEDSLKLHAPDPADGLDVLSKVGGFEIAGLAGVILGAASRRIPIILDGFISGAAALVAATLSPAVRSYLIAGHRSAEPGHAAVLSWLDLRPLIELDLRLGEGTGAMLALPIVRSACRLLSEMATFEQAGVTSKNVAPEVRS